MDHFSTVQKLLDQNKSDEAIPYLLDLVKIPNYEEKSLYLLWSCHLKSGQIRDRSTLLS